MSDIPTTSGIYKITCTVNKKIYIGSAVNLCRRRNDHFNNLQKNKHGNPKLQNAWNKYGEDAFTFEVLEYVLPISLAAREQYWFKKLKPFDQNGFNIAPTAGSTLGHKDTPETCEKKRQVSLGRKRSPETKEKHRQSSRGNKSNLGRNLSPETRKKIGQANIGKKHTPESIVKGTWTRYVRRVLRAALSHETGMFAVIIPRDIGLAEPIVPTDEQLILYINNKGA